VVALGEGGGGRDGTGGLLSEGNDDFLQKRERKRNIGSLNNSMVETLLRAREASVLNTLPGNLMMQERRNPPQSLAH
jgi:hypothetical protein